MVIGHEIVRYRKPRAGIVKFPEQVVVLVALPIAVFLGEPANLVIELAMDHRAEMQPRAFRHLGTPDRLSRRHQRGVTEPPEEFFAPARCRDITPRGEQFPQAGEDRPAMNNLGVRQDQNITPRSLHTPIECSARIERHFLVRKPDDRDRPRKLAGLGRLGRTVVNDDDLKVISGVQAAVLIQVPA